jgi:hypothetical protein
LQLICFKYLKVANAAQQPQSNKTVERSECKNGRIRNPQERTKQRKTRVDGLEQLVKRPPYDNIAHRCNYVDRYAETK